MQVTFLIGNGFDLGIGLKTAYSDFYRVYCAETQKDDENLRNFKSAIQLKSETWSDFENAFGKYSSELNDTAVYLELFENFVNSFISYIRNEEQRFDESKLDNAVEGMSMAKQDNYKKERTETALSFHFSDFGMRGYISMVKPSGLFLRFSFSF